MRVIVLFVVVFLWQNNYPQDLTGKWIVDKVDAPGMLEKDSPAQRALIIKSLKPFEMLYLSLKLIIIFIFRLRSK